MLKYISMHIKSQLEYKASFIFLCISQALAFLMCYFTFYALFDKFGMIDKFNIYQVILCFSVVQFGETLAESLFRGFDKFSEVIKNGDFDLLLVRPQNIYIQVMGTRFETTKLVKTIGAVGFLTYGAIKLGLGVKAIPVLVLMLVSSTLVFSAILILGAALCFVTTEGLEVINIFVYGTRDFAQYPIGIFNQTIQKFFTYIIPIGLTSYYPMLYLTGVSNNMWYLALPVLALFILVPAVILFNVGVKKYKSSGS